MDKWDLTLAIVCSPAILLALVAIVGAHRTLRLSSHIGRGELADHIARRNT